MNFRSAIITVCAVALAGNSAGCKKSSKTVPKAHSTGTTDDKTVQTEGIHMTSGPETVKQIAPIGEKPIDQTQA